jgi:diacylglycerol kinase (ATP)
MTASDPTISPAASIAGIPPSRRGLPRLVAAGRYALAGWRATWRHEAAFRQEVLLGVPLIALAGWLAPGRWQLLTLVGSVVLVWMAELLNSAVETLADAVSSQPHPLIGRAKDQASGAVLLSLLMAAATWAAVFWP